MKSFHKRIRSGFFILVSAILLAGLAACTGSNNHESANSATPAQGSPSATASASGQPKDSVTTGGILRFARTQDAVNLDPIKPVENMSIWTLSIIYDTLVRAKEDSSGYEPGLATDWTISPDGKTFVFNLRKGVKFHNGDTMTAEDVRYSLERVRGDKSSWNWLYTSIDTIKVTGDNQVTITTKEPYAPMLSNLSLFAASIVPKKVVEEKGDDYLANNPVGTGPFMLDQWQRGQKITLKKNPDYWQQGKPYLDGVEFSQEPEDTTRILKLRAGQIDVSSDVPYSSVATLQADANVKVNLDTMAGINLIHINVTKAPFNDPKIRQAMNYAVDRNGMIKSLLLGNGTPATSFLPKVLYYDDKLPPYDFDVAKAKQLMAQSSKPNGFKTTLITNAGNELYRQISIVLKQQLAQIGIDVDIQQLEPGTKEANLNALKYELAVGYVTADVIDPDELTTLGAVFSGGAQSFSTGYKSTQVEDLAKKARAELDETKRKDLYAQIQKIVKDDAPFIYLFDHPSSYATTSKVQGFKVMITGNYRLENVWLNK